MTGAVFGAFVMVAVAIVFAWVTSGPDHQDWTHAAVAMGPVAAIFGAAAGAVGGLLLRVTRPPSRRSQYTSRRDRSRGSGRSGRSGRSGHEKRKYL